MVRPAWSMATLAAGSPRFRGLEKYIDGSDMRDMLTFIGQELGGSLDWDYLDAVRQEWDGPLVLKGILTSAEAERAVALGFDGIMVSNHGGRQFDGAPAAIDALPAIAHAVGAQRVGYRASAGLGSRFYTIGQSIYVRRSCAGSQRR